MAISIPLSFGYVTGRYVLVIGDTTTDPDRDPDVIAATGTVTLTPVTPVQMVATPPPATAVTQPVTLTIDSNGFLLDPAGAQGAWLVVGFYKVTFQIANAPLPAFTVQVTGAHTLANPLDLTVAAPATDPPSPVPSWTVVTQAQYDAMVKAPQTVYLISG